MLKITCTQWSLNLISIAAFTTYIHDRMKKLIHSLVFRIASGIMLDNDGGLICEEVIHLVILKVGWDFTILF
jgi:hypothetical protein